MKRILFILFAAGMLASCQKADDNGDLGGYWKLIEINDFANDSIINTREEQRFWAIQLDLIQIKNSKGRFQHVGDSLFVQMIEVPGVPEKFGLYNPKDERFEVIELNRRRMTLRSRYALLRFRKF